MSPSPVLALVLVLGVLTGCDYRENEPLAQDDEKAPAETQARSDGNLGFVPATYREGDRVILPLTFPDGASAELVYPPELEIAELGAFPYSSGRLPRENPTHEYGEVVGRDFVIRYGDVDHVLAVLNGGTRPRLVARYRGADGANVGLWDLRTNDTAHYLGFRFEGSGRLRLARAGEAAGPQLTFSAANPERSIGLHPGECQPHRDRTRLVDGKLVEWSGESADWCLSDSMRIHATGGDEFIGELIGELDIRNVTLATN